MSSTVDSVWWALVEESPMSPKEESFSKEASFDGA
jgi:hypothetical protein